jgi:rubrerythrin
MRTGRTQENTNLNVRARQRTDEEPLYPRRVPPPQPAYDQTRYQYSNNQYNSMRPTAVVRPSGSINVRCGECGVMFNNTSARYCPQCGARR